MGTPRQLPDRFHGRFRRCGTWIRRYGTVREKSFHRLLGAGGKAGIPGLAQSRRSLRISESSAGRGMC